MLTGIQDHCLLAETRPHVRHTNYKTITDLLYRALEETLNTLRERGGEKGKNEETRDSGEEQKRRKRRRKGRGRLEGENMRIKRGLWRSSKGGRGEERRGER